MYNGCAHQNKTNEQTVNKSISKVQVNNTFWSDIYLLAEDESIDEWLSTELDLL